jgi:hypothetical protein
MERQVDFSAATKPKSQRQKPLPPAKLYDLEPIKKQFAVYSAEIDKMVAEAEALELTDTNSMTQAVTFGTLAKQLFKKIEEARKRETQEPGDFVRTVNRFAKTYQDRLKAIEDGLKKKISDFRYQKELERREAELKAEKERQKLQEKLDEEAEVRGVETVQVEPQVVPKEDTTTRTETGTSHQRLHWTFEIVDAEKIPREYLIPDEKKLRQAVAMGLRKIPGLEIFEKASTVFRT